MRNYVYAYLDLEVPGKYFVETLDFGVISFDYQPFYIGRENGDKMNSYKNDNERLDEKIRKGLFKTLKIKDNISIDRAISLVTELIYKIGRADLNKGPLLNECSEIYLYESKKEDDISPYHLEFNKLITVIKSLNKNKTNRLAAKELQVNERMLYRIIKNYKLKKNNNVWDQFI